MQTPTPFQRYPDTWIKVWIWLGVLAFFLFLIVPVSIALMFVSERVRARDCLQGSRQDCQPSLIWLLQGWTVKDGVLVNDAATTGTTTTTTPTTTKPSTTATSTAPVIVKVSVVGASYEGGAYRMAVGSKVTIEATVANAKTVSVYLVSKDGSAKKLATMTKQPGGLYSASYTVKPGLAGQFEVRAVSASGETASVAVDVAAK